MSIRRFTDFFRLPRALLTMSSTQNRSNLIKFSSRLKEGRALALDVWSIFRYPFPHTYLSSSSHFHSAANLPADCINLGQGYMNFAPPTWITAAAEDALKSVAPNHYSHPRGRIRLREALKSFYGPQFHRDLDVESEILVTSGANEGVNLHNSFLFNSYVKLPRPIFSLHRVP